MANKFRATTTGGASKTWRTAVVEVCKPYHPTDTPSPNPNIQLTPPLPPNSRHKNPHRHRPRRLPPARRSHRPAHRLLPQPSPILHLLLPNNRSWVGNRHTVRCPLPRSVQEHRPRNPRGHPPKNELLCEPRPQRLRRRRLKDPRQLEVHWLCGDVRAWRQTRHRSKSTQLIASLS